MSQGRTKPDRLAEHGSHRTRWLAVLGVALTTVGVVVAATTLRAPPADVPVAAGPEVAPFVVEPQVQLEPVVETMDAATLEAKPEPQPHRATAAPKRLVVPKLGVDAPVIRAHVTDGTLWPPDDPQTLGWWAEGAKPGALRGGALITGHTVSSGGGAFDDLETLRRGDAVRVRTDKGVIGYKVTGVTIYRKATLAKDAQRVFSQTGPGRLVLITCEDWNGEFYESNAIVFAERRS